MANPVFKAGFDSNKYSKCDWSRKLKNTRKPASWVFLAPPEGLTKFLSSLYHAWQLLLAKFFDLVKLEFWPSGPPSPIGVGGSNLNSLFRALWHEDLALSIWFGYYKRFLRSLAINMVRNQNQRLFWNSNTISLWKDWLIYNYFCAFLV